MKFWKNEGYLSPLLLSIELFVHKVSKSRLLVDVFHLVGCLVSYSKVLKFKKCAALSSVNFDDFASDIELSHKIDFGNS